jgi:hypothetical protein
MIKDSKSEHITSQNIGSKISIHKKKRDRTKDTKPHDSITGPYDSARSERSMWVAVITQAMMDALTRSRKPEEQFSKFEAIRWLTGNSADFKTVCMLAGMEPGYVRSRAKKALISETSWRAAAGTGKRYEERKAYRNRHKKEQPYSPDTIPMPINCMIALAPVALLAVRLESILA